MIWVFTPQYGIVSSANSLIEELIFCTISLMYIRGSGWGSGIHYSLKFSQLFISFKVWVIH